MATQDPTTELQVLQQNTDFLLRFLTYLPCVGNIPSGINVTLPPTPPVKPIPIVSGDSKNVWCFQDFCKYQLRVANNTTNTLVYYSTDPSFSQGVLLADLDVFPGAYLIKVTQGQVYYARATNDGSNFSNTYTVAMKDVTLIQSPTVSDTQTTTTSTSSSIPAISSPTVGQVFSAVAFPYSLPWSESGGTADDAGYAVYNQVSLSSDFSTVDGIIGNAEQNGGFIVVAAPGKYYVRSSNDNTNFGYINFQVSVVDVSSTPFVTVLANVDPTTPTSIIVTNDLVAGESVPNVGNVYTGMTMEVYSDAALTTLVKSQTINFVTNNDVVPTSATSITVANLTAGNTYYVRERMQIDGVWSGWSTVVNVTI